MGVSQSPIIAGFRLLAQEAVAAVRVPIVERTALIDDGLKALALLLTRLYSDRAAGFERMAATVHCHPIGRLAGALWNLKA